MLKELDFEDKIIRNKISKFLEKNKFAEYTQSIEWNIIRNEKIKYYLYFEDNNGNILWVCSLLDKSNDLEKCIYANRGPVLNYESGS